MKTKLNKEGTSIYFPKEGTKIPAAVRDINAGGMETNQARGATSKGWHELLSLVKMK